MARRGAAPGDEAAAFVALCRAYSDGRVIVHTDPKVVGRPGSPAYSIVDVFAPPLILFAASITLLVEFGMIHWIVGMVCAILFWSFVQPPIVRWRAARRARRIAFGSVDGMKAQWRVGGFALVLKDWPDRHCVAPKGDWRAFAVDYLVPWTEPKASEAPAQ